MAFQVYQPLPFGITRIDTAMGHDELAACYLLEDDGECAIIETGTHNRELGTRTKWCEFVRVPDWL